MKNKPGRNDPCHCGSGKKLKACHGQTSDRSPHFLIMGVVLVLLLFWFFFFESESPTAVTDYSPSPFIPKSQPEPSAPSEPAPPGKVWSQEHGHWHDDPSVAPSLPQVKSLLDSKSQPSGTPPQGKVWSPEHNHWHNK